MSDINITEFVLEQRRKLFAAVHAAGISTNDVVEKVDRRFPFGNWKHPVEVWKKPVLSNGKGKHLANYWLSFPKKGSGKTVKFNLQTFESISSWLVNKPSPQPPATKFSSTATDTSQF